VTRSPLGGKYCERDCQEWAATCLPEKTCTVLSSVVNPISKGSVPQRVTVSLCRPFVSGRGNTTSLEKEVTGGGQLRQLSTNLQKNPYQVLPRNVIQGERHLLPSIVPLLQGRNKICRLFVKSPWADLVITGNATLWGGASYSSAANSRKGKRKDVSKLEGTEGSLCPGKGSMKILPPRD